MARRSAQRFDVRHLVWLKRQEAGWSVKDIAADAGVSVRSAQLGLKLARDRASRAANADAAPSRPVLPWWRMRPTFPIGAFTRESKCPHHGPIRPGSDLVCMVCHGSGLDDHPGMVRDAATDPRPEPKPRAAPEPTTTTEPTRRRRGKDRRPRAKARAA